MLSSTDVHVYRHELIGSVPVEGLSCIVGIRIAQEIPR